MKKNRFTIAMISVLAVVTAVAAAVHLSTRAAPPRGILRVEAGGQAIDLALSDLEPVAVQGTVVNGKGDEKIIEGQGELLSDVLEKAGISGYAQVSVVADDAYSVTVTAEEIAEADRVYLLLEDGQAPRLLVFGDPNSKRNVSNVIRLVAE